MRSTLFAFAILISSCNKIPDILKDRYHDVVKDRPCRLATITSIPDSDLSTTKIFYDQKGRPEREERTTAPFQGGSKGNVYHYQYFYSYDKKGRLLSTKQEFAYPVNWVQFNYIYEGANPLLRWASRRG